MYEIEVRDPPTELLAPVRAAPAACRAEDEVRRARAALERAWRTDGARRKDARLQECAARLNRARASRANLRPALRRELEWAEISARCLAGTR